MHGGILGRGYFGKSSPLTATCRLPHLLAIKFSSASFQYAKLHAALEQIVQFLRSQLIDGFEK